MTDHYAHVLADLHAQRERIDIAIAAIKALRPGGAFTDDLNTFGTATLHINGIDEGEGEPPKGPMPKPFAARIAIPTDPAQLEAEANRLLNSGMGMMEVAHALEMTEEQAARIFRGA